MERLKNALVVFATLETAIFSSIGIALACFEQTKSAGGWMIAAALAVGFITAAIEIILDYKYSNN